MAWPIITDEQRDSLLREPKPVVANRWDHVVWPEPRAGARQLKARLRIRGDGGHRFHVSWRQSRRDPDDFCIALRYYIARRTTVNLIRCDGCHSPHTNAIEKAANLASGVIPKNTPHVHIITERYQRESLKTENVRVDDYAEPCGDHYCTFGGAFLFFWAMFGFYKDLNQGPPARPGRPLFQELLSIDTFHV